MQITFDTASMSRRETELMIDLLRGFLGANFIKPEDNPETGIAAIPSITQLTKELQARGLPPPPNLSIAPPPPAADPAVVFRPAESNGGAAAQIPPVGQSVVVIPPPPPAQPPALPGPPAPSASSPSTAGAPPAPPAAPGALVDLDSEGLPWDVRIHGTNRAKNQNGTWRAKRGVNDAAFVANVKAELRAVQALPRGVETAEAAPAAPPAAAVFGAPGQLPLADAGAAVSFGTVGAPPAAPVPTDFPSLMTRLTPAMTQGRVTQALLTEACAAYGLPSLPILATRPDLIASVFEYIRARVQL